MSIFASGALVVIRMSQYRPSFQNMIKSSKIVRKTNKQVKFGKSSKKVSAAREEVFGEARNSSVKIEAYYFSKFQQKYMARSIHWCESL